MASNPVFVATPKFVNTIVNNANAGDPAYSSPTTIATLLTISGTGGRLDSVSIVPVGTNAASAVRLWIDTVGSGGSNNKLLFDVTVPATTSTTVAGLTPVYWSPNLVLPVNCVLRATIANTAVTNGVCISVEYGEF